MKLNLSASVKHITQRLNPDLIIPDGDTRPTPPSSSALAPGNGNKSPSRSSFSPSARHNSHNRKKNPSPLSKSLSVRISNNMAAANSSMSNSNRDNNKATSLASSSSNTTTSSSPDFVLALPPWHHRRFAAAKDPISHISARETSPISTAPFPAPRKSDCKSVDRPITTTTNTYKSTLDPGSINRRTRVFTTVPFDIPPAAAAAATATTTTTNPASEETTTGSTATTTTTTTKPSDAATNYFCRNCGSLMYPVPHNVKTSDAML